MRIHIVQKGDTLFEIAKQYGVDFEELTRLNSQLSSPDMIMPGMKIKIPGQSKQVKGTADKATRTEPSQTERTSEKAERVAPTQKETVSPERDKKLVKEVKPIESRKLETRPQPVERPIGKDVADDKVRHKKIEVKVPKDVYPVRPIIERPKMPKKIKLEEMPEEVRGVQVGEDVPPMVHKRANSYTSPERELYPVHQAMHEAMQYYYPMHQQMSHTCHCCSCCSCRRGSTMPGCHCAPRHQQRGTYYNYQPNAYNQTMPYYYPPGYQTY